MHINNEVVHISAVYPFHICCVNYCITRVSGCWTVRSRCIYPYRHAVTQPCATSAKDPKLQHAVNAVYGPGRVCAPPLDSPLAEAVREHIAKQVNPAYPSRRLCANPFFGSGFNTGGTAPMS